jgi:EmrB/QacA subfamily drug resistance transporter
MHNISGGSAKSPQNISTSSRRLAMVVLLIGAFLPPLDFFIVNLALPSIRVGLKATGSELQLVISFYASAYAVFLITGGKLGDLYGRKKMFMTGLAGFVFSSALCGFAPTGTVLVTGRVLQGISAAVMAPQVLAAIRNLFSTAEQPKAIGLYGSVFGLASVIGQLLGGALITLHPFGFTWESIFLINLPIGLLAFIGAARFLPETQPSRGVHLDLLGVLLLSLFLGSIIYPLTQGREAGWPVWTFISFGASVPLLALFIWVEHRIARTGGDPLIDLRLFKNSTFVIGLVMAFLFYCISAFYLTFGIYLQSGLSWSALASGIAILPYTLGFFAGSLGSANLFRRIGNGILNVGFGLLAIGFGITALWVFTDHGPGTVFYLGLVTAGAGQGFLQPSTVRIVLTEVEPQKAGLAAGVVTSALQVASAFGVAGIGSVFFSVLGSRQGPSEYGHSFATTLGIVALVQVAGMLLAMALNSMHARRARAPEAFAGVASE